MARFRVLIVGGGKVTESLLHDQSFRDLASEIIIIEKDPKRKPVLEKLGDVLVIEGDATDISIYEEINMKDIFAVLALTNSDEINLMVLAIAKSYEVPLRIGRFTEAKIAELVRQLQLGIAIVQPITIAGIVKQTLSSLTDVNTLGDINGKKLYVVTIGETDIAAGTRIGELRLEEVGAKIIMMFDGTGFKVPSPDDTLYPGVLLFILASNEEFLSRIKG
ncbi:MAG: NAD-binding protein [Desulfurococcaceae archaeon]